MSLPAALLARLKKRGIVTEEPRTEEEVFAENYDEEGAVEGSSTLPGEGKHLVHERSKCPNQSNPWHECVEYCFKRWGRRRFRPDLGMFRLRERMLKRYPLPVHWIEVADPLSGRFYYWNTETEEVSWLSPSHPRSKVTQPEEKLRKVLLMRQEEDKTGREEGGRRRRRPDSSSSSGDSDSDEEDRRREKDRRERERDRHRDTQREKDKKKKREEELDPMDPASYSDVGRGSWTTGLDLRGSAKTGVDATASGPLFQQRPYPSPGDILRQNAQIRTKGKDD